MTRVEVDGVTLEVEECGEGRDVVLVHGSASDRRTWTAQRAAWCDAFHLVSYSRRYHWPNDPIEAGAVYAMDRHVADLYRILDRLALAPATLVGHSYGAVTALLLACRAPELVEALVLIEPPVLGLFVSVPPAPTELLGLLFRRPRTALAILKLGAGSLAPAEKALRRGDQEEAMRRMGIGILGREAYEALSSARRRHVRENTFLEELESEEALPRLDRDVIASVRCPILLVQGDSSPALFSYLLDALEAILPRAERITVPGASHLVHEDNPEAFHRSVERFLDRV